MLQVLKVEFLKFRIFENFDLSFKLSSYTLIVTEVSLIYISAPDEEEMVSVEKYISGPNSSQPW